MMLHTFFLALTVPFSVAAQSTITELPPNYGTYHSTLSSSLLSKIHLFQCTTNGSLFAVKEFMPREPEKEYKTISEFEIGKSLASHDHIVSIFDMIHGTGSSFQTMEYIPHSLRDWVMHMDGVPTDDEAACIFRQILDAVAYMHSVGIAHLDLKLPNVMFAGEGPDRLIKVIDFGCAVRFVGVDGRTVLNRGPIGTIPFIPPEAFTQAYDPRQVDIWAIAIIYSQMLKPHLPWRCSSSGKIDIFGIFSFAAVGEPTEEEISNTNELFREVVLSLVSVLPKESRRIIGKMLEPDPLMRAGWAEIWTDEWVRGISCGIDDKKRQ